MGFYTENHGDSLQIVKKLSPYCKPLKKVEKQKTGEVKKVDVPIEKPKKKTKFTLLLDNVDPKSSDKNDDTELDLPVRVLKLQFRNTKILQKTKSDFFSWKTSFKTQK